MIIEFKAHKPATIKRQGGFLPVSPVESWSDTPAVDYNDCWYFGATIETSRLLPDVEQRFLSALSSIGIFPHFKAYSEDNHVVTINEWIYGVQQDALYEIAEDFGLTIQKDC